MSVALESILKRDRQVVAGGLALVIVLAWSYLLAGAGMEFSALEMMRMTLRDNLSMDMDMAAMRPPDWSFGYAVLMFVMWWIMMMAMMLPSAASTILLAAALNRKARADRAPFAAAGYFAAGYLLTWAAFSLVAVAAQWSLEATGTLAAMMHTSSPTLAGLLLVAAALWQFAPLKHTCLRYCRSPVQFLTQRRRHGRFGGLAMGIEHGVYCLGCCAFLMTLLFVGGVMNLIWIIGLALLVLIEKTLPFGPQFGKVAGAGFGLWGLGLLAGVV